MLDLFLKRRSVRKYKEIKVEDEKIKQILGAGQIAPSGKNKKPWEFKVIEDKSILEKLSTAKPKGGIFLAKTPVAIVVIGKESVSDTWVEDCSIASTFIQLEAENQGLGSCWVQIKERFDAEEKVKELLSIEKEDRVLCIISLGYKDEEKPVYKEEDYIK